LVIILFLLTLAAGTQTGGADVATLAILDRYVNAVGGEAPLRAIGTRITDGHFDNGRGLSTRFRIYEQAPNRRATVIGTHAIESAEGSGRGHDGAAGWDKNFIGTGLRNVTSQELADLARDSDMLRPLRVGRDCETLRRENPIGSTDVVRCQFPANRAVRYFFNRESGLLERQESPIVDGTLTTHFEDYRVVDGVRLPFKTRIVLPAATIVYTTEQIRHNVPIEERVFRRPDK
jgi:hypothetical protein